MLDSCLLFFFLLGSAVLCLLHLFTVVIFVYSCWVGLWLMYKGSKIYLDGTVECRFLVKLIFLPLYISSLFYSFGLFLLIDSSNSKDPLYKLGFEEGLKAQNLNLNETPTDSEQFDLDLDKEPSEE